MAETARKAMRHSLQKQNQPQTASNPARSRTPSPARTYHAHIDLQRTLGNQSTRRFQKKRNVGAPEDKNEQEADRIADQPMRTPTQRSETGAAAQAAVPSIVHEALHAPGHPLDSGTRAFFEARLGYDLGHVRVHTDRQAADSARAVDALSYTVGRDVVFAEGEYAPQTSQGKKLLAHELTHVAQQGGAAPTLQRQAGGGAAAPRRAIRSRPLPDATPHRITRRPSKRRPKPPSTKFTRATA